MEKERSVDHPHAAVSSFGKRWEVEERELVKLTMKEDTGTRVENSSRQFDGEG